MTPSTPLKDLLAGGKVLRGAYTLKSASEDEPLYPVVGIRALENGAVNHDAVESLALKYEKERERATISPGDILLSKVGPLKIAIADEKCTGYVLSQNLLLLRFREGVDPWMMFEYLNTPGARAELAARTRGLALPMLSIADLETLPVPHLSERAWDELAACMEAYRDYEALARQEEDMVGRIKEALVADYLEVKR